jgi:hypothetical protein
LAPGLTSVEIAAGGSHTLARLSDGSIVAWGSNNLGQCNVPALPTGVRYVDLAAGRGHSVARRSDGNIMVWGDNSHGQRNVPVLPPGLVYVGIAAGENHVAALRSDGSVIAWGSNSAGQCNVPALPAGMRFVRVAAVLDRTIAMIQPGACNTFAPGCPGSAGVTSLAVSMPPRTGTTIQIALQPLPQDAAVLLLGFSNVIGTLGPLPWDLTAFGMPGCFGRVAPDLATLVLGTGSSGFSPLVIPSLPWLAGTLVHSQAVVLDAAAGNAAGLVMSDAATLVVGR